MEKKRPIEPGWMPLKKWAEIDETPYEKALAYANENSKRTAKRFHPDDVDVRSRFDIRVWFQPHGLKHFNRPRLVDRKAFNPSNQVETGA